MNDLIHQLQLFDIDKPHLALKKFENMLHRGIYHTYLNINRCFYIYTNFKINKDDKKCIGHYSIGYFDSNNRCGHCFQKQELKLINNTGVPSGKKCVSKFYEYYDGQLTRKKVNANIKNKIPKNKLVIEQIYVGEYSHVKAHTFIKIDNLAQYKNIDINFFIYAIWTLKKYCILGLDYIFELPQELKNIIKLYIYDVC